MAWRRPVHWRIYASPGLNELTRGFLWSQWRGQRSRHSRYIRNLQFCVSDKRPRWRHSWKWSVFPSYALNLILSGWIPRCLMIRYSRQDLYSLKRHRLTGWWIPIIKLTLRAKFFRWNIKYIFTFYAIPPHWYSTGGWNPSSNKTRTYPFYIVNIMAAVVLATQGTRTLAAMILTYLNRYNSFPARLGFKTVWPS